MSKIFHNHGLSQRPIYVRKWTGKKRVKKQNKNIIGLQIIFLAANEVKYKLINCVRSQPKIDTPRFLYNNLLKLYFLDW